MILAWCQKSSANQSGLIPKKMSKHICIDDVILFAHDARTDINCPVKWETYLEAMLWTKQDISCILTGLLVQIWQNTLCSISVCYHCEYSWMLNMLKVDNAVGDYSTTCKYTSSCISLHWKATKEYSCVSEFEPHDAHRLIFRSDKQEANGLMRTCVEFNQASIL